MLSFEIVLEIFAMITSWIFLKYSNVSLFKWITMILTITVLNEALFIPEIIRHHLFERDIAYNIFSLLDMASWLIFYYSIFQNRRTRLCIFSMALLNFTFSLFEIVFIRKWQTIHSYSHMFYDFTIIGFSVFYLFTLLKKEYHNLWSDSIFFVCIGAILYHIVLILNFAALSETAEFWKSIIAHINYDILQNLGNFFYYILLSIAFYVNFYNYRHKIRI